MKKIIYISDFFADEILGGAELSDNVVIEYLANKGYNIKTVKSQTFDPTIHKADTFIISNFTGLSKENINLFCTSNIKYIIIERDQKYVDTRNTAMYPGFIAPPSRVVNKEFYRSAIKVFCLTSKQAEIMNLHLEIENIENLGCTQFSKHQFDILRKNIGKNKEDKFAIVSGKRSNKAIQHCEVNKIDYDFLNPMPYEELIETLSKYKGIVFFSHAFESCCRLLVESRILELKIITDNRNGCTYEAWFKNMKGIQLLEFLEIKVDDILKRIESEI